MFTPMLCTPIKSLSEVPKGWIPQLKADGIRALDKEYNKITGRTLIAEIEYLEKTKTGALRMPVIKRIRTK